MYPYHEVLLYHNRLFFFYHQNDFKAVILGYNYCIIKIYFVGN